MHSNMRLLHMLYHLLEEHNFGDKYKSIKTVDPYTLLFTILIENL